MPRASLTRDARGCLLGRYGKRERGVRAMRAVSFEKSVRILGITVVQVNVIGSDRSVRVVRFD